MFPHTCFVRTGPCFLILVLFEQEQFKETEGMVRKLNSALTTQEAVQKVKALEEENEDMAVSAVIND